MIEASQCDFSFADERNEMCFMKMRNENQYKARRGHESLTATSTLDGGY